MANHKSALKELDQQRLDVLEINTNTKPQEMQLETFVR